MHIFVTGATGYVGHSIARRLLQEGHSITALVRAPDSARSRTLAGAGAVLVHGDLETPETFLSSARACDAIVHAGFAYDSQGAERTDVDTRVTHALFDMVHDGGQARAFVYTSSLFCLNGFPGRVSEEIAVQERDWRLALEREVLDARTTSCSTAVVRLGWVYGGRGGTLFQVLRPDDTGLMLVPEPGTNHWPFIHVDDAAALYSAVLQRRADGIFHAADDCSATVREVAEAVARCHGHATRVQAVPAHAGPDHFREFWPLMNMDIVADTARSKRLGWSPSRPCVTHHLAEAFAALYADIPGGYGRTTQRVNDG